MASKAMQTATTTQNQTGVARRPWSAVAASGVFSATAGLAASAGFAGSVVASPGAAFSGSAGGSSNPVLAFAGSDGGSCNPVASFSRPAALESSLGSSTAPAVLFAPASISPVVSTFTSGAVANRHVTPSSAMINRAGTKLMIN